jgi:4-hydroxy-tetrahydrodipicolinate synthase
VTARLQTARIIAAAATPFRSDLGVDHARLLAHTRWLLANGCDSVLLFGSTGEAASLTLDERQSILENLSSSGVPTGALLVGAGCCAIADTVRLVDAACAAGCAGVLVQPPFFFKGVSDEGVEEYYCRVIEAAADRALRLYLYHYPQAVGVGISIGLTERLLRRFPSIIAGYKDSSGDFAHCCAVQKTFPELRVYVSNEARLLELLALGGAGCISATANVQPGAIRRLVTLAASKDEAQQQAAVALVRKTLEGPNVVSNVKAVLAQLHDDPEWRRVRPPLLTCSSQDALERYARLSGSLDRPG